MKLALSVLLLTFSSFTLGACERPTIPGLPDGMTADMDAMVEGQKALKAYLAAGDAYLACIDAEQDALGEAATPEQKASNLASYNTTVDEMKTVAATFNEEVREYKEKSKN